MIHQKPVRGAFYAHRIRYRSRQPHSLAFSRFALFQRRVKLAQFPRKQWQIDSRDNLQVYHSAKLSREVLILSPVEWLSD